jgi:hypothetical protein
MFTSDAGSFRTNQALHYLRFQAISFSAAPIRRIAAGIGLREERKSDLQKRMEWFFRGKAPISALPNDQPVLAAVMMASALPEDDFDAFLAATTLLLIERLRADGLDNRFWNWTLQGHHYRLAQRELRAAIMCGFRESTRTGRIRLGGGPDADDCLTRSRTEVLALLDEGLERGGPCELVRAAIDSEASTAEAGLLWAEIGPTCQSLANGARHAAFAGFRYLYERPASMEPPPAFEGAVIPVLD